MVAEKQKIPFFTGTHHEVGDRILSASLEVLLEATTQDPTEWRGLIVRRVAELTPFEEVVKGCTQGGLFLRDLLLFREECSPSMNTLFEVYGEKLWGIFSSECMRIISDGIFPHQLIDRIHLALRYDKVARAALSHYVSRTEESTHALRFAAAIALSNDWSAAREALHCSKVDLNQRENALLGVAFELSNAFDGVFSTELLLEMTGDTRLLPELRAAAFKCLSEGNKGDGGAITCAFLDIVQEPGSASTLHAACWRAPKYLPPTTHRRIAHMLLGMHPDDVDRGAASMMKYDIRSARLENATAHYFLNLPEPILREFLANNGKAAPRPVALAAIMLLAKLKEPRMRDGVTIAAEFQVANFFQDETNVCALMRMYEYPAVPGRLSWTGLQKVLRSFPELITTTCANIAPLLRGSNKNGDWPTAERLVCFLEAAWKGKRALRSTSKKQLILIRDCLAWSREFPDAAQAMTALITELGLVKVKSKH